MTERAVLTGLVVVTWVLATVATGCGSNDQATSGGSKDPPLQQENNSRGGSSDPPEASTDKTPPDRKSLRPVSLPDLSQMAESVQAQLREYYTSLRLKMENPGTPAVELGNAYGEIGKSV